MYTTGESNGGEFQEANMLLEDSKIELALDESVSSDENLDQNSYEFSFDFNNMEDSVGIEKRNNFANLGYMVRVNDVIYFANPKDDYKLYSYCLTSMEQTKLLDNSVIKLTEYDNKLFFIEWSETESNILSYDLDNQVLETIVPTKSSFLYIDRDRIFYTDQTDGASIYKYDISTSLKEKIVSDESVFIMPIDQYLFYSDWANWMTLKVANQEDQESVDLGFDYVSNIIFSENKLYFTAGPDYPVVQFDIETSEYKNIVNNPKCESFIIKEDSIVYVANAELISIDIITQNEKFFDVDLVTFIHDLGDKIGVMTSDNDVKIIDIVSGEVLTLN